MSFQEKSKEKIHEGNIPSEPHTDPHDPTHDYRTKPTTTLVELLQTKRGNNSRRISTSSDHSIASHDTNQSHHTHKSGLSTETITTSPNITQHETISTDRHPIGKYAIYLLEIYRNLPSYEGFCVGASRHWKSHIDEDIDTDKAIFREDVNTNRIPSMRFDHPSDTKSVTSHHSDPHGSHVHFDLDAMTPVSSQSAPTPRVNPRLFGSNISTTNRPTDHGVRPWRSKQHQGHPKAKDVMEGHPNRSVNMMSPHSGDNRTEIDSSHSLQSNHHVEDKVMIERSQELHLVATQETKRTDFEESDDNLSVQVDELNHDMTMNINTANDDKSIVSRHSDGSPSSNTSSTPSTIRGQGKLSARPVPKVKTTKFTNQLLENREKYQDLFASPIRSSSPSKSNSNEVLTSPIISREKLIDILSFGSSSGQKKNSKSTKPFIFFDLSSKELTDVTSETLMNHAEEADILLSNVSALILRNNILASFSSLHHLSYTCPNLKYLDLGCNNLSGKLPLNCIPAPHLLKRLDLSYNQLTDISSIVIFEQLEYLNVSNNNIKRISALPTKYLKFVDISNNALENAIDIRAIALCKELRALSIHHNPFCEANIDLDKEYSSRMSSQQPVNIRAVVHSLIPALEEFDGQLLPNQMVKMIKSTKTAAKKAASDLSVMKGYVIDKDEQERQDKLRSKRYIRQNETIQDERQKIEESIVSPTKRISKEEMMKLSKRLALPTESIKSAQKDIQQTHDQINEKKMNNKIMLLKLNQKRHSSQNASKIVKKSPESPLYYDHATNMTQLTSLNDIDPQESINNHHDIPIKPSNPYEWIESSQNQISYAIKALTAVFQLAAYDETLSCSLDDSSVNKQSNPSPDMMLWLISRDELISNFTKYLQYVEFYPNVVVPIYILEIIQTKAKAKSSSHRKFSNMNYNIHTICECRDLIDRMSAISNILIDLRNFMIPTSSSPTRKDQTKLSSLKTSIEKIMSSSTGQYIHENVLQPVGINYRRILKLDEGNINRNPSRPYPDHAPLYLSQSNGLQVMTADDSIDEMKFSDIYGNDMNSSIEGDKYGIFRTGSDINDSEFMLSEFDEHEITKNPFPYTTISAIPSPSIGMKSISYQSPRMLLLDNDEVNKRIDDMKRRLTSRLGGQYFLDDTPVIPKLESKNIIQKESIDDDIAEDVKDRAEIAQAQGDSASSFKVSSEAEDKAMDAIEPSDSMTDKMSTVDPQRDTNDNEIHQNTSDDRPQDLSEETPNQLDSIDNTDDDQMEPKALDALPSSDLNRIMNLPSTIGPRKLSPQPWRTTGPGSTTPNASKSFKDVKLNAVESKGNTISTNSNVDYIDSVKQTETPMKAIDTLKNKFLKHSTGNAVPDSPADSGPVVGNLAIKNIKSSSDNKATSESIEESDKREIKPEDKEIASPFGKRVTFPQRQQELKSPTEDVPKPPQSSPPKLSVKERIQSLSNKNDISNTTTESSKVSSNLTSKPASTFVFPSPKNETIESKESVAPSTASATSTPSGSLGVKQRIQMLSQGKNESNQTPSSNDPQTDIKGPTPLSSPATNLFTSKQQPKEIPKEEPKAAANSSESNVGESNVKQRIQQMSKQQSVTSPSQVVLKPTNDSKAIVSPSSQSKVATTKPQDLTNQNADVQAPAATESTVKQRIMLLSGNTLKAAITSPTANAAESNQTSTINKPINQEPVVENKRMVSLKPVDTTIKQKIDAPPSNVTDTASPKSSSALASLVRQNSITHMRKLDAVTSSNVDSSQPSTQEEKTPEEKPEEQMSARDRIKARMEEMKRKKEAEG